MHGYLLHGKAVSITCAVRVIRTSIEKYVILEDKVSRMPLQLGRRRSDNAIQR